MDILVVDDNDACRLVARAILEREGHSVSMASSGREAIDMADGYGFGAVLLDILMPGMSGVRTLRRIVETSPQITAFALTSYADRSDMATYLAAGFDGVIAKPLNTGDFRRALDLVDAGSRAILPNRDADAADVDTLPLLDLQVLSDGLGQAAPRDAAIVLSNYRRSMLGTVRTLQRSLPGALAYDPIDLRRFREALHALRGASAMIGMRRAPALAGSLRNAPPDALRDGVRALLRAMQDSLPALERALASDPALLALGEVGPAVQVGGQDEPKPAHHHQDHRAAIGHER